MSTTEGSVDLRRAPASLVTTWKYSLITYKQLVAFTKNAKMMNNHSKPIIGLIQKII